MSSCKNILELQIFIPFPIWFEEREYKTLFFLKEKKNLFLLFFFKEKKLVGPAP